MQCNTRIPQLWYEQDESRLCMGRSAPTKDGLELFHIDHALYDVPQRTGADPGKYELDLEPSWW